MPAERLHGIRTRIENGDRAGAKRQLLELVRTDLANAAAWGMLAGLIDDPAKKADCYRQALIIDPDNRHIATALHDLENRAQGTSATQQIAGDEPLAMVCRQCGGKMQVYFVGEMRDKRAACRYCGTEVDLPDTFQRVRKHRNTELHWWGSRTTEEVVVETRRDRHPRDGQDQPAPELEEIRRLLKLKGFDGLDDDALRVLSDRGVIVLQGSQVNVTPEIHGLLEQFAGGVARRQPKKERTLSPTEIVRLAGKPISPEERRECPKCGSVVSRNAARCQWCSEPLSGNSGGEL